jgi:hypothetical protein
MDDSSYQLKRLGPPPTDMGVCLAATLFLEDMPGQEGYAMDLRQELQFLGGKAGVEVEVASRPAALGLARANFIRCLLPARSEPSVLLALADRISRRLPVLWGACGLVFHHTAHARRTAHTRMAALAKRCWCIQIQDTTALQWDALAGMPSVNWLNIVGRRFAQARGLDLDETAGRAGALRDAGVFTRFDHGCLWLAAGARPVPGDINRGEDIGAYVRAAQLLELLLLKEHTPLAGPFARPEVLAAWLGRFSNPQAWLDCEVATG